MIIYYWLFSIFIDSSSFVKLICWLGLFFQKFELQNLWCGSSVSAVYLPINTVTISCCCSRSAPLTCIRVHCFVILASFKWCSMRVNSVFMFIVWKCKTLAANDESLLLPVVQLNCLENCETTNQLITVIFIIKWLDTQGATAWFQIILLSLDQAFSQTLKTACFIKFRDGN